MLDLINQERASYGLGQLQLELRLNDSSEDYSTLMLDQDFFSHTGPGGTSPGDRMEAAGFVFSGNWTWGENLAWQSEQGAPGLADDVVNLHTSLMNSPGHRANILNPDFELIGIGIELGDYNGWDAVMVTQNFATTSAALQLDTGDTPPPPPPPEEPANLTLSGTSGNDVLTGGGGNDTVSGNAGDDEIHTKSGNDVVYGGAGDDTLTGGANHDVLGGSDGNDGIWGNGGHDTVYGGEGRDTIWGGGGRDEIYAGSGDDTVYGGGGHDILWSGTGDDMIRAGKGNDVVYGLDGNDDIGGAAGADTLDGGAGNDTLKGGSGGDTFVFSDGNDQVIGFNAASAAEKVDLSAVSTITGFDDLKASHLSLVNGNAVISDNLGNTMTLLGVGTGALDAGDFLF